MSTTPVAPESIENVSAPSRKREISATVIAAALTIGLGIGANILIEKTTDRVKNKIAPKKTVTE